MSGQFRCLPFPALSWRFLAFPLQRPNHASSAGILRWRPQTVSWIDWRPSRMAGGARDDNLVSVTKGTSRYALRIRAPFAPQGLPVLPHAAYAPAKLRRRILKASPNSDRMRKGARLDIWTERFGPAGKEERSPQRKLRATSLGICQVTLRKPPGRENRLRVSYENMHEPRPRSPATP
jgi:hypothetical protein